MKDNALFFRAREAVSATAQGARQGRIHDASATTEGRTMDGNTDSAAKDAEGAKGGRASSNAVVGNVSKAHRERLLAEVAAIKSFLEQSGDKHATRLLSFAADLEKEVRGRKFGLIFEEHRERVDAELEANIPVLEEVKERFISHGGTEARSRLNLNFSVGNQGSSNKPIATGDSSIFDFHQKGE